MQGAIVSDLVLKNPAHTVTLSNAPFQSTLSATAKQRTISLCVCITVAIAAHLIFVLLLPAPWNRNQSSDYATYYEPVAQNLVAGNGLSLRSKPALVYPPGIPLLYAATFWVSDHLHISHGTGLRILEGLFIVATSVLIAIVAMRIFDWRVALASSILWSTYPFHLWLTKQPDPTTGFAMLLLTAALLFFVWSENGRNAALYGALSGVILGVASLVKPFNIAMPVVFVGLAWICAIPCPPRRRMLFSCCVVLFYLLPILPWEIWAWRTGGHWIPLCTNAPNVAIDGLTFGTVRGLAPIALPKRVQALTEDAVAHSKQLKTTTSIATFLVTKIKEEPAAVTELYLVKATRSWYDNESHIFGKWIVLIQLFYLPFVILGARTVWKGTREQKNFFLVAIAITLYFWTMTTMAALAILRYMVPAVALLMVFVAVALKTLATSCFQPRQIVPGLRHGRPAA
jgi:4-amino-4-deoxy-L-arabinose transferase-like glycosyltransferase